jgi:putative colanic acid biosynthesis acetyltransferase WcaF
MIIHKQSSQFSSPWSFSFRLKLLIWEYIWILLCIWTPKPANPWRLFWLKIFGCKIYGKPFVHQRARIQIPWNLILHNHACLGDRANAYSLGLIEIKSNAIVSQEVYLCTGTHNFKSNNLELITEPIIIESGVFIGARSFILPGVTIGQNAIVGACSVVTNYVPPNSIIKGNPAK